MYELVPPKSKLIDYKSVYLGDKLTFKLKVFDFEEDEEYSQLIFKHAKKKGNDFVSDEDGNYIIDNESYYTDMFRLGVKEIHGLKGKKFKPAWKVIKEIVNKIRFINSVQDTEK